MDHVVDAEASQDRDQDGLHRSQRPSNHRHDSDDRHDGAEDGEGREEGEKQRPGGEAEHDEGNSNADNSSGDSAGAVDSLVVHEHELLLLVCHQHALRPARVSDKRIQLPRQIQHALIHIAHGVFGQRRPLVERGAFDLERDPLDLAAVEPDVLQDHGPVLDLLGRIFEVGVHGRPHVGQRHRAVARHAPVDVQQPRGAARHVVHGLGVLVEAVQEALGREEAVLVALHELADQRVRVRHLGTGHVPELQHVARVDELLLALRAEGEVLLEAHLSDVLVIHELVHSPLVECVDAPRKEGAEPRVLSAGGELLVQDRDRVLERVIVGKELLGRLGRLELSDVDDGRDQPRENDDQDDDAALEAEDEVGEGGAEELGDLVHADLDPVMERAQVHLRRRRLLVVAAAALGAAPAAVRDRASWLTLEPVVVDDDRGAKERHHQDVVPQDHEGREDTK
mmetsp:Transcript_92771/g.139198  ORF Transcript_92771/g.139198 Transcript_92771/m.139198 type:complete len:453 (+) Transcript_92771:532-1890(+)